MIVYLYTCIFALVHRLLRMGETCTGKKKTDIIIMNDFLTVGSGLYQPILNYADTVC